jgi:hypothetical protein
MSWVASLSLSCSSVILREKKNPEHGISKGKVPNLFVVNVIVFCFLGLTLEGQTTVSQP